MWRHRLRILGTAFIFGVSAVAASFVFDGYLLGLTHGAIGAVFTASVLVTFLGSSSGTVGHLVGAWGEDFTRDALRRAKRRHHIWGWVDSLEIASGDIDHLVIAPSGIHATDSKWRGQALSRSALERDLEAAKRATSRARSVLRSLRPSNDSTLVP